MTSKKKTKLQPVPAPTSPPRPAIETLRASIVALQAAKIETMAEAAIFCDAATHPDTTLAGIVRRLHVPFSTASRVLWSMSQRGLISYQKHPTDRRKKLIVANVQRVAA